MSNLSAFHEAPMSKFSIPKDLADVFESVAASIYVDSGQLDAVWRCFYLLLKDVISMHIQSLFDMCLLLLHLFLLCTLLLALSLEYVSLRTCSLMDCKCFQMTCSRNKREFCIMLRCCYDAKCPPLINFLISFQPPDLIWTPVY